MGTIQDHRKCAEECFAMAQLSRDGSDKALWLTLAQSWMSLAEYRERAVLGGEAEPSEDLVQDNEPIPDDCEAS
jgi:hypothetical protein